MREYKLFLKDILEAISNIEEYTENLDFENFKKNKLVQDAILRNLEIIGEAAKNIPTDIKEKYENIEWRKIAGLRDVIIHSYFGVDLEIVWDIIKKKLPELKRNIKTILSQEED